MFDVTPDAITAMTDAARIGNTIGTIDDAHRAVPPRATSGGGRLPGLYQALTAGRLR